MDNCCFLHQPKVGGPGLTFSAHSAYHHGNSARAEIEERVSLHSTVVR